MLQATGVAAVSALAGCGGGGGGGGDDDGGGNNGDADLTITISDGDPHYEPSEATVSVGDTVVWEAETNQHSVQAQQTPEGSDWTGRSSIMTTGQTYEHTFQVAGEYEYSCFYHNRTGSLTVTE